MDGYGEDTGDDGLYALEVGDVCYIWQGGERVERVYTGPDANGTENDGHLSPAEDEQERPEWLEYTLLNEKLDFGDGLPDFKGPPPPPAPDLEQITEPILVKLSPDSTFLIDNDFLEKNIVLRWRKKPSEDPDYKDPFSREWDFEGYRIYVSNVNVEKYFALIDEFDRLDWAMYNDRDSLASRPVDDPDKLPLIDKYAGGVAVYRKKVGPNIGFFGHEDLLVDTLSHPDPGDGYYYYIVRDAHPLVPKYYAITSYDYGDYKTGTQSLESARIANSVYAAPSGNQRKPVGVCPNPYRADQDYTKTHGGVSWENRDDGTDEYFPQTDRRLYFYNLPKYCLIRIYTVAGDLVDIVPHNVEGDDAQGWKDDYAEPWDLNSRNHQQVVSGMYLFTVEEMDENNNSIGDYEVGKFAVIR